jgi:hypothetical protein
MKKQSIYALSAGFLLLLVCMAVAPVTGIFNGENVSLELGNGPTVSASINDAVSTSEYQDAGFVHHVPPLLPGEKQFSQKTTVSDPPVVRMDGLLDSDFEITLLNGWNVISVPRTLADGHNNGTVFGSIDTAAHSIFEWDGSTQMWSQVFADTIIRPLDAICIYSNGAQTVQLEFKDDPYARKPVKSIYSGWNGIGFSDVTAETAAVTLDSVDDVWSEAIGFDATTQQYEVSIINGGSGEYSDQRLMYPGKGYWLYSNGPGTLVALSA